MQASPQAPYQLGARSASGCSQRLFTFRVGLAKLEKSVELYVDRSVVAVKLILLALQPALLMVPMLTGLSADFTTVALIVLGVPRPTARSLAAGVTCFTFAFPYSIRFRRRFGKR